MKSKIWFPLWVTLIIYWLITIALLATTLQQTHGFFGYPLDDTYIHMAISKNFVTNGFWGVSQTGFSSSTSSPLWTWLISVVYRLFGVNEWAPLALGFIFGNFTIILCYFLLRKKTTPFRLTIILLLIILITPLPIITMTGMEHSLHGLLSLWLIYQAATVLSNKETNSRHFAFLLFLSSAVTITRYEGLFLIFVISFLLMISKRFIAAFLVVLAGLLPITVYGLISLNQGWYFFPNSILLKGNLPVFSLKGMIGFLFLFIENLYFSPYILLLIITCLFIYLWGKEKKILGQKEKFLLVIILMITLLHMQFARTGRFYRYDAYIVLAGYVILADAANSFISYYQPRTEKTTKSNFFFATMLSIFLVLPLITRVGSAFQDYPIAVKNIFEQQYQMGTFVKKYYEGKNVAANDIGEISYLANIKLLDLWGLGSMDIAQAKRKGQFNKNTVAEITKSHDVDIVIIYNSWFEGNIPSDWIEIGRWQISNNVICGSDTVSFYVPKLSLETEAISNLREFSVLLPSTVKQSGKYFDSYLFREPTGL